MLSNVSKKNTALIISGIIMTNNTTLHNMCIAVLLVIFN